MNWTFDTPFSKKMEEWRSMKHKGEHTFKCIESYTNNKKITHCTYLFLELRGLLTRAHVSEMFFNSEMETEVRAKSHRLQWTWICNGDRESFMNKIIDDEAALYNHSQTPDCVEKGYIIIIIFIHFNIFFQHLLILSMHQSFVIFSPLQTHECRLWEMLEYRWELEAVFYTLYVPS